jgi:hypothetical protein
VKPPNQSQATARGAGTHYVFDLIKGATRKYLVERSCEEAMACYYEATSVAVEPEIKQFVLELTVYRQVTQGSMKSWFTVTTDGSAQNLSAFDVAGPGAPRELLFSWFTTSQAASIRNALPMVGAAAHSVVTTIASLWNESLGKTWVTVLFSDGSQIILEYELVNHNVSVVPGSAKDKYGNPIPATLEQLNGSRFDYSGEGPNGPVQQRMRNYLTIYGVAVTSGTRWACVSVANGGYHCAPY